MKNYDVVVLITIVVMVLVFLYFFFGKKKKNIGKQEIDFFPSDDSSNNPLMNIKFELLSSEEINENQMIEIIDKQLLAKIDNYIPNAARAAQNANAAKQLNDVIKDSGQLYQAIIPKGATLDKSRAIKDTFRGTFREAKNSIQGQANFKPVDGAVAASQVANVTNAVMNVGSMVVGQYYMSEINSKLDDIDENLNKISSFQNDEYKSKIMALSAEVKRISEFQIEVLENEEIRKRKLDKLDSLEHKTAELLGQANLALDNYKQSKDFKEYEKQIKSADEWFRYQQILLDILYQIDNLIYVLNSGNVSKEQCFNLFDKYGKLSTNTLNKLSEWHNKETQEYKIDIEKNKRQKLGIEGFFAKPISLINKEYGYKKVDKKVTKMISKQSNAHVIDTNENIDLYKEDIVLIQKDGKTYYLPYKENN